MALAAAAVSCGCRRRCNYVLAGQPSVSFQKFTGFLITLLIWVHGGGDGETQTGARLFAREHLLSIDSRCQSVNWTKKKVQRGEGVELKMQASPTSYYLLTPKMNYWNGRRKILANGGEAGLLPPSFPNSSSSSPPLLLPVHLCLSFTKYFLTFPPSFSPSLIPLDVSIAGVLYFYPFASVFAALFICIIALDGN